MPTKKFILTTDHIIWAAVAILYAPALKELYGQYWGAIDYTHAFFILPVSIFLAWLRRFRAKDALASGPASPACALGGMVLLIGGLFLFLYGWQQGHVSVVTFSLIPVILGLVLYRYNCRVARVLLFPISYLLLMVPPPLGILDAVTLPLRTGVASAVAGLLGLFYTVQREGLMLTIDHAQVFIGKTCSGLRSMVSVLALALVYMHLVRMERWKKLILIAAVIPLALVGNFVRVVALSLVAYYFGKEVAEGWFHGASGMAVFLALILGMIWLGNALGGAAGADELD